MHRVIGGAGGDEITALNGVDHVLGDHGTLTYNTSDILINAVSKLADFGGDDVMALGNGDTVVIAGAGNDAVTTTGSDNDTVLGDFGEITWSASGVIERAVSTDLAKGGDDSVALADGDNLAIAGHGNDEVTSGNGDDIVVGDGGETLFSNGRLVKLLTTDSSELTGGNDIIVAGAGFNRMLGGSGDDQIRGLAGVDHAIGDHGELNYTESGILTSATSKLPTQGGNDVIDLDDGHNRVIAGMGDDSVAATFGDDHIIGDNGILTYDAVTGIITKAETTDFAYGGIDSLIAGDGNNIVLGGFAGDIVSTGAGDDTVVGDNGEVVFTAGVRTAVTSTDMTNATGGDDVIALGEGRDQAIAGVGGDQIANTSGETTIIGDDGSIDSDDQGRYLFATTGNPDLGGNDKVSGGRDRDIILGGAGNDELDGAAGNDLVSGDGASVTRDPQLLQITFETIDIEDGGVDALIAGDGNDYLFGGTGGDLFDGDTLSDVLIGEFARVILDISDEQDQQQVSLVTATQSLDTLRADGANLYDGESTSTNTNADDTDANGAAATDSIIDADGRADQVSSLDVANLPAGASAILFSGLTTGHELNGARQAGIDLVLPTAPTATGGESGKGERVDASGPACGEVELSEGDVLTAEQLEQAMDACLIPEDREALRQDRAEQLQQKAVDEKSAEDKSETVEVELEAPAMGVLAASALGWKFTSGLKSKSRQLERSEVQRLGQEASQKRFKRWEDIRFW